MIFRFHKKYFALTVLVFLIEVCIAMYIDDAIIRPYFGDTLVVLLLYYGIRSFFGIQPKVVAIGALLFCYLIEIMQYFKIVTVLGLQDSKLARIIIGSSFSWFDMIAYTLGFILILWLEKINVFKILPEKHS